METYIKRNNQQIVFFNGGDKYMKHKFTMAILTILGFCTFQNTVEATTSSAQFTNPFISKYHYVDGSGAWGSFEKFTRSDGQFAYCIQPNASWSISGIL